MKKIRIISFTEAGFRLAGQICSAFSVRGDDAEAVLCAKGTGVSLSRWTEREFRKDSVLIFVGACGIAVRATAPFLKSKTEDPAVLVTDEKGAFCIPILSGHLGEANRYAELTAEITGGVPVITTATDVNRLFAVDVFASENGMAIGSMEAAKRFSADLLKYQRGTLRIPAVFSPCFQMEGNLPRELAFDAGAPAGNGGTEAPAPQEPSAGCLISPEKAVENREILQLIPRCLVLGVGCRKGQSAAQLFSFTEEIFREQKLDLRAVRLIASIDLKKDEPGLLELSGKLGVPFVTFSAEQLMAAEGSFSSSEFVRRVTGADNVCERACAAAGAVLMLTDKRTGEGMTAAVGVLETVLRF